MIGGILTTVIIAICICCYFKNTNNSINAKYKVNKNFDVVHM